MSDPLDIDFANLRIIGHDRATGTDVELVEYAPSAEEKIGELAPRRWKFWYGMIAAFPFVVMLLHTYIGEKWHYTKVIVGEKAIQDGKEIILDKPYFRGAAGFATEYHAGIIFSALGAAILVALGVWIKKTNTTLKGVGVAAVMATAFISATMYLMTRPSSYSIRAFWTGVIVALISEAFGAWIIYHVAPKTNRYYEEK